MVSATPASITITPVIGLPEVKEGDDLAAMISEAATARGTAMQDGDVVVVAQKVVSKSEGRVVNVDEDDPLAKKSVVIGEAARIVRRRGNLIIAETRHGFVCANAGVDSSNVSPGLVCLLPIDPDLSARRLMKGIERTAGVRVAVIVSDTFGRPWREGQTNVAIGLAGIHPLVDYRGQSDSFGRTLRSTAIAVADELAGAAELVMGKSGGVPVALIRGAELAPAPGRAAWLVRPAGEDLFR